VQSATWPAMERLITAVNQNSILAALNSVLATMTFSAPMIPTTSAIQVVIPNTGTTWTSGTAQTITWTRLKESLALSLSLKTMFRRMVVKRQDVSITADIRTI